MAPAAESIRMRQAVRPTPAVTVVVGISRSFASGGNVPATPSMVHGVARPKRTSGFAVVAANDVSTRTRIWLAGIGASVVPG